MGLAVMMFDTTTSMAGLAALQIRQQGRSWSGVHVGVVVHDLCRTLAIVMSSVMYLMLSFRNGSSRPNGARGLNDVVLIIQKRNSFLVETAVGIVIKILGSRAVHIIPPITNQSDLVKKRHIRTQIAEKGSRHIAASEDLTVSSLDIGIEARLVEGGTV